MTAYREAAGYQQHRPEANPHRILAFLLGRKLGSPGHLQHGTTWMIACGALWHGHVQRGRCAFFPESLFGELIENTTITKIFAKT